MDYIINDPHVVGSSNSIGKLEEHHLAFIEQKKTCVKICPYLVPTCVKQD
mgnify:CR=1 FL=1